ncbi:MAG: hypothetical protein JWN95_2066 [Frankiales bacterium]|nr:hypothetical protein [Frankiales bacterium]
MIKYVVLYPTPEDASAFDDWYFATHAPLVAALPGLRRAEYAKARRTVAGPALYLSAELYFDSYDALKKAFATPEWSALGADLEQAGQASRVLVHIADVLSAPDQPV